MERGTARGEKRKWKELKKGTDWRWGEARRVKGNRRNEQRTDWRWGEERRVKGNGRNEQRDWKWGKVRRGKRKWKE